MENPAHLIDIPDHRQGFLQKFLQRLALCKFPDHIGAIAQHRRIAAEKALDPQIRDAAVAFAFDADHLVNLQRMHKVIVLHCVVCGRRMAGRIQKVKLVFLHGAGNAGLCVCHRKSDPLSCQSAGADNRRWPG